jgi:adenylate cyclase
MVASVSGSVAVTLRVPRAQVWPFVADTDRVNRVLGNAAVDVLPVDDAAKERGVMFVGATHFGPLKIVYDEYPFDFVAERYFSVRRTLRSGPVEEISYRVDLRDDPNNREICLVEVVLSLLPRNTLVSPVSHLAVREVLAKNRKFLEELDGHLSAGGSHPFQVDAVHGLDEERYRVARRNLLANQPGPPRVAEKIAEYLAHAPDADVVKLRPYEVADALNLDRRETLVALLAAVPAGLVELRWAVVCPSCQAASGTFPTLEAFAPPGHCDLCDLTYAVALDEAVEAVFVPHAAVRRIEARPFCLAGPGRLPHVVAQAMAPPSGEASLVVAANPGRFRLFARGGFYRAVTVEEGAPTELRVPLSALDPLEGGEASVKATRPSLRVAPGGTIYVQNSEAAARPVKLERLQFASRAATALAVSQLPEFARLLGRDLLRPGTPLAVSRVALFFSDLVGSTALYASVGDAAAFRLVADHFDVLRAAIEAEGGVVVKTMGDAVMASFPEEGALVRAAGKALEAFEEFRASTPHGAAVGLKVGGYAGPCYVVRANETLDYFGQTVNVAARLQGLAGAGEHVALASAWDAIGDQGPLVELERFTAQVKGVPEALLLVRVGARRERTSSP